MLRIAFNYNTLCSLYSIVLENRIKIIHGFFCIIREDHSFSAIFKIIKDRIFLRFGNIGSWCVDQQARSIIRDTFFCDQVQRFNINICFLDIFLKSRIQVFFTMSIQCIKNRKVFGSYIGNSTVDLSFSIESCRCGLIRIIINRRFINTAVIYNFASVTTYHDQAVCSNIITGIF